jgi:uncharacterized protein YggE
MGIRSRVAPTWVGALSLLGAACGPVRAQQPPTVQLVNPVPQIVASAQGEARVTPDRGRIFVGVETRAPTAATASSQNASKQRAIFDTLRAMGVPTDQYSTVEYSVYPEQVFNPERGDREPRITAYVVRNVVRVEVRQIEQVGRIIDAVLAKGANQIHSLQFYASNEADVRRSALAQAIERATADACAMARAAGGTLTGLLEVSEAGTVTPYPQFGGAMMDAAARQAPTPINPGEQTLTVSIVGRWSFRAVAEMNPSDRRLAVCP